MFNLKAFVNHSSYLSNTPNVVSQIAELSPYAGTFSREKGYYRSTVIPEATLITFLSEKDDVKVELSANVKANTFAVLKTVFDYFQVQVTPFTTETLSNHILLTHSGAVANVEVGFVHEANGYYVPEWVSWIMTHDDGDATIRIWLMDEHFRYQYDEWEIIVVPPTVNLNMFFSTPTTVKNELAFNDPMTTTNRIQAAKGGFPETILRTEQFEWNYPGDNRIKLTSSWHYLIYGPAGDNIDVIKDRTVAYILANSNQDRNKWTAVFPDIFRRTEFMIVPYWEQYAIEDRVIEAGIRSPIVTAAQAANRMKPYCADYLMTHVDQFVQLLPHPHKSMQLAFVSSEENKSGYSLISELYPDYINVSSTSVDFNRMRTQTRQWAEMLTLMIVTAETMTKHSMIPIGMSRIYRYGKMYLVSGYKNVQYFVAAKINWGEQ
jgi:hypothetical protein